MCGWLAWSALNANVWQVGWLSAGCEKLVVSVLGVPEWLACWANAECSCVAGWGSTEGGTGLLAGSMLRVSTKHEWLDVFSVRVWVVCLVSTECPVWLGQYWW